MADRSSLIIIGTGGLGREVAALVEAVNRDTPTWTLEGFVDDDPTLHGTTVLNYPVHGDVEWLAQQDHLHFAIAIGNGDARRSIAEQLSATDVTPVSISHPSVSLHRTAEAAPGTIFCKGAATTVDLQIGPHSILNLNCTVGHDSTLGAFVTLHPGVHISGSVTLAPEVTMGTGSVALPGTSIGRGATVGAGAVVVDDLPPHCTAVGVPARPQP
jgi:sugar O-acyltransferase (sialic acid O-acetyltransferase NeuD family)